MCGIAGIIGEYDMDKLDRMLSVQHHRGPDDTGRYSDAGFAALGHNRLAIIDLSPEANQPYADNSGRFILVFNGEIYNYIEIRKELEPHYNFSTHSDTEVLLAAYMLYGRGCLDKFNGMFSFAIWDNHEKTLFAARDRFGVKPFYYAHAAGTLYFSSEIKALHAAGIIEKPNEKTWASYFAYGSYGNVDETFWDGVRQLPGGYVMTYKNGIADVEKWYFFEREIAKQPKNLAYEEAKDHYTRLLKDSIALRFRADVSIGFNISGGLDSSVLLAFVNGQEQQKANINAYTFYTGHPDYDEIFWVEAMIAKTGNPLVKVLLNSDEVPDFAKKIQIQQDEPYGGLPTLAYAKIFEQARKDGVTVLLDGQGMDEQWAGYDYYAQNSEATIQGVSASPFKPNMLSDIFLAKAEKPSYPKPFPDEMLNKQYRDLFYTKLPRALRFNDRISMAFSTELREPFLDYRLVEFAFSLPADFKIRNGISKFMLREIASEYLSDDLVFAPKRPLQTPQREWLADDLKQWVVKCFDDLEQSALSDWFNITELRKELSAYLAGNIQSGFHIWQVISLGGLIHANPAVK